MNSSPLPNVAQPPPMEALIAQLSFIVYATARAMAACYRPLLTPLGLTHTQYLAMLVLWDRQQVTVGDLGERLHLDSGTISPLLTRLKRARLIHRHRRPGDERVVEVSASDVGRALRTEAAAVPPEMAQATGMTSAELTSLRDTLQVLIMRLRAAERRLPSHL